MASRRAGIGLALLALAAGGCFNAKPEDVAGGGGVETTEGNLAGAGLGLAGSHGARVSLIPADFDPLRDSLPDSLTVLTDGKGRYRFRGLVPGRYNLEAYHPETGTRCFRPGVVIAKGDSAIPGTDTLALPGRLRLGWDGTERGVLTQIGRRFRLDLAGLVPDSGHITLDSLPAGMLPPISYLAAPDSAPRIWTDSVRIAPGEVVTVPLSGEWAHSAILTWDVIDMPSMPPEDMEGYPLLVRLTAPGFPFGEASAAGADIRFTTLDGDPLPHEVERWDSAAGRAEVWVRLKARTGGSIRMDWGSASSASPTGSVFDSAAEYGGVWHLAEPASGGSGRLADAGPFDLRTIASDLASDPFGVIGAAQRFDGIGGYAYATDVAQVQRPSLLYLSAWISPDTAGLPAGGPVGTWTILSKWEERDSTGFILGYSPKSNSLRLTLGFGAKVSHIDQVLPQDPSGTWHRVVAAYDGTVVDLWWDGSIIASLAAGPGDLPANTRDIMIGARAVASPDSAEVDFFRGRIDEARALFSLPSEAWVELDYQIQKPNASIIGFQKLK